MTVDSTPNPEDDAPTPSPAVLSLAKFMRSLKLRATRRHEDTGHIVDAYRHGKRILRVAVEQPEDILNLLYNAPGALHADSLVLAADAWQNTDPKGKNPITGEDWSTGDMQRIVEQDMGLRRGIIGEQLLTQEFCRDGTEVGYTQPYTHDRDTNRITWGEPYAFVSGGGRFPSAAAEGFARKCMDELMVEILGPPPDGISLEDMLRKTSVTYALKLSMKGYVVLEGPKGPPLAGTFEMIFNDALHNDVGYRN